MSQVIEQKNEMSQQRPMKHARAAALALALVPLAAVAVSTQVNEPCPSSGGICGTVFSDTDGDGIQDADEPGIPGVTVTLHYTDDGGVQQEYSVMTNGSGVYNFGLGLPDPNGGEPIPYDREDPYTISVGIPNSSAPSPANQGSDDGADSDGVSDNHGNVTAQVTWTENETWDNTTDFGFTKSTASNPGTGTPGYWKNHPEAWPVETVTVGGVVYTKVQALSLLDQVGKDKSLTMFSSLVPAMLNVLIGNDSSCVAETIAQAQTWMATYGPVGSKVAASSYAWRVGEPLHRLMDNYNNGMLCAPHRE